MLELFTLTSILVSVAFLFISFIIIKKDKKGLVKYIIAGLVLAILDLAVELVGTTTGTWKYDESVYFVFGTIPIELLLIFFSLGVIGRSLWVYGNQIKTNLKMPFFNYNIILYFVIALSVAFYLRSVFLGKSFPLLILTVPVGLWGVLNIKRENLEVSLILAILIFFADLIIENLIIANGAYSYSNGFNIMICMEYSLLALGFFGVMEKLNKLDKFIESKFIRSIIRKSVYKRRKQVKKALRKLNSKLKKFNYFHY